MLRVVIVDDEPAARRTLRECCAREPDLAIVGEFGDAGAALDALTVSPPDLLFLDIHIEPCNGIELARALNPAALPCIVFVTAYDRYALEAFEVCASDYLLKPFDHERFRSTMARVHRRRGDGGFDRRSALAALLAQLGRDPRTPYPAARIIAESGSSMRMLDAADIELVEGDRNYVKFSVGAETYHARSTLQNAAASLAGQPMLRISRSCLVNVNHTREVSRTPRGDFIFVLRCGRTVTSSEGHRETVRQYLNRMRFDPA
ncbi:MAG TPA: LytTR family DNA-binding domain-containing protein [Steroidobacteraceae bacterium]|nr:LytTR family DNA-binding domain-containing protein [Steroidobacteraceae bacterium]